MEAVNRKATYPAIPQVCFTQVTILRFGRSYEFRTATALRGLYFDQMRQIYINKSKLLLAANSWSLDVGMNDN